MSEENETEVEQKEVVPEISKEDDLLSKKQVEMSDVQKNDYIEKLKDENAKRRIKAKKLEQELADKLKAFEEKDKTYSEIQKTVDDFKKKEQEKELAEKTELEKLAAQLKSMQDIVKKSTDELNETKKQLTVKDLAVKKQSREIMVDRLVQELGYKFASDYERRGFLSEIQEIKDKDFMLNDEEVLMKTKEFIKMVKTSPEIPKEGPPNRVQNTPLIDEVKELLSIPKGKLSSEQHKRLITILNLKELGGSG